ncbi:MAG TPA: MmgE/PrpD family protein [Verrucomicrobiae bacterium]|jgi:2-methylcitrate dehydratase PrpD|nr:MmgE/PrpD family protein [Verrucomicrobiae bacterium]
MSAVAVLSKFATTATVRGEALRVARGAFLDTVGVTLAGAVEPAAGKVQQLAALETGETGAGPCRIFGTQLSLGAGWAALANGTAAHALDYDDMCFVSLAHPSAPLVSALLALGEKTSASGKSILEAYVIGFEVEAVLGRMLNPRHYQTGWHCTSTIGTVGTAAACARLLQLDAPATANCLAIAASSALGLKENFGTMTKPLHAGLAAQNSVLAALLAQTGFTASDRALDGPQGLFVAMAGERVDYEWVFNRLGRRWEILATGITVKLYPSCAATHPALDAVMDLRLQNHLAPEQIAEVDIEVDTVTPNLLIHDRPQTGLEAKFSMPFCVAAALVDGKVGLETFESRLHDPRIRELLPRVTMRAHPALGQNAPPLTQANVALLLRDGREFSKRANGARGYPEQPASPAELEEKFMTCARRAIPAAAASAALDCLRKLEGLPNIHALTKHLAVSAK